MKRVKSASDAWIYCFSWNLIRPQCPKRRSIRDCHRWHSSLLFTSSVLAKHQICFKLKTVNFNARVSCSTILFCCNVLFDFFEWIMSEAMGALYFPFLLDNHSLQCARYISIFCRPAAAVVFPKEGTEKGRKKKSVYIFSLHRSGKRHVRPDCITPKPSSTSTTTSEYFGLMLSIFFSVCKKKMEKRKKTCNQREKKNCVLLGGPAR